MNSLPYGLKTKLLHRLSRINSKAAMELTLDQALQKGIEAHKAGKVQKLIVLRPS